MFNYIYIEELNSFRSIKLILFKIMSAWIFKSLLNFTSYATSIKLWIWNGNLFANKFVATKNSPNACLNSSIKIIVVYKIRLNFWRTYFLRLNFYKFSVSSIISMAIIWLYLSIIIIVITSTRLFCRAVKLITDSNNSFIWYSSAILCGTNKEKPFGPIHSLKLYSMQ